MTSRAPPPRDRRAPTNGRHRIRLRDKSYNPDRASPTPSCNTRNGSAQKRPVDVRPLAMPRYIFHLSLLISFLAMLLVGRVPFFAFPLSVSFRSLFSLYILPTRHVLPTSLEINLNFPSRFLVPLFHDISGAVQRRYRWEQPFPSIFLPLPSSILTQSTFLSCSQLGSQLGNQAAVSPRVVHIYSEDPPSYQAWISPPLLCSLCTVFPAMLLGTVLS